MHSCLVMVAQRARIDAETRARAKANALARANAIPTPWTGWSPTGARPTADEELTEKVPAYLTLVARSFEQDPSEDTQPDHSSRIGTNALDALDELEASELADAFASVDKLESVVPAPLESGVVPVGLSLQLEQREVIPPPAALPRIAAPFPLPPPPNAHVVVQRKPRAAATRASISRCIASGVLALVALLMLVVVAKRPDFASPKIARAANMLTARAPMSAYRRTVASAHVHSAIGPAAPRSTTVHAASTVRGVRASGHAVRTSAQAGRIVRAMPF